MDKNLTGNSNSDHGLEWSGSEPFNHSYLFVSKTGSDAFVDISKELNELNDFCIVLYRSMNTEIENAKLSNEVHWKNWAQSEESELDEVSKGHYSYDAKELGQLYCPASALVMLYAVFIRGLHTIAAKSDISEYKTWKNTSQSDSELLKLIKLLRTISGTRLEIFDDPIFTELLMRNVRSVRNSFVHGNWEKLERDLKGIGIRNCFEIVSSVLTSLENVFNDQRFPPSFDKLA